MLLGIFRGVRVRISKVIRTLVLTVRITYVIRTLVAPDHEGLFAVLQTKNKRMHCCTPIATKNKLECIRLPDSESDFCSFLSESEGSFVKFRKAAGLLIRTEAIAINAIIAGFRKFPCFVLASMRVAPVQQCQELKF